MNVVVVKGRLSRQPEWRELGSGDVVVSYELTVDRPGEKAETVPVSWPPQTERAAEKAASLEAGDELVVVGRVRRRFFRTAAGTQSRTEVVADEVVPARSPKRVAGVLARAAEALDGGGGS
jgi:single-strand DNA-binding protein